MKTTKSIPEGCWIRRIGGGVPFQTMCRWSVTVAGGEFSCEGERFRLCTAEEVRSYKAGE